MMSSSILGMAWRNLWRNRRRSLVTIISLAFGFSAIALFAGYTGSTYVALANAAIHAEAVGHLTINKTGWQTQGKLYPSKFLLTEVEIAAVNKIIQKSLKGSHVLPRMSASGLLSNGRASTIFMAIGISPADQLIVRGPFRNLPGALEANKSNGITLAQGLAETLDLHVGDSASVLSSTIHGQANAADVDLSGVVNTNNVATNDKLAVMPLALAQDLMDAKGRAEMLTVLLPTGSEPSANLTEVQRMRLVYTGSAPDETESAAIRDKLVSQFKAAGLDMEVRTWQEMSAFYRQVKSLYDMIFVLMLAVVLAIVVLSIANAMSMAVVERTREIGTLRAIGLRRSGIASLFILEAVLLVVVGTLTGLLLTSLARYGVNAADIRYVPPSATSPVSLYIGFDSPRTMTAAGVLGVLAVVAAFLPARRAARNPIIESLGHV